VDSLSIAGLTAVSHTVQHVNSARPDAPVMPDRRFPRPALTLLPARAAAARALRRLADVVAPRTPQCLPGRTPHVTAG
jgi:hypothetical protein